jgi:hypothetical protein
MLIKTTILKYAMSICMLIIIIDDDHICQRKGTFSDKATICLSGTVQNSHRPKRELYLGIPITLILGIIPFCWP